MVFTMTDIWGIFNLVNGFLENEPYLTYLLRLWFIASVVGFMFGFLLAYIKRIFFTAAR